MLRVFFVVLGLCWSEQHVQAYKDWYFGVHKVPDYRMMALKPVSSPSDSIMYTCSAAVDMGKVGIQFLINFRNLSVFCAPPAAHCRIRPLVVKRNSVVRSNLSIIEAQLEFWSTKPMTGTVSCVFTSPDQDESLAQLYGFFRVFGGVPPPSKDEALKESLCNVQQGCHWEEKHCQALNHENCNPCQQGMGFDRFYHLCYDPRQLNQSCVFKHQCTLSDHRSSCVERLCTCNVNHVFMSGSCMPMVDLGFLCGPGTVCKDDFVCREHACQCRDGFFPTNGECIAEDKISIKDMLVIITSIMIVFTAFTSMLCLLLCDKYRDDDDSIRFDRSKISTAPMQ